MDYLEIKRFLFYEFRIYHLRAKRSCFVFEEAHVNRSQVGTWVRRHIRDHRTHRSSTNVVGGPERPHALARHADIARRLQQTRQCVIEKYNASRRGATLIGVVVYLVEHIDYQAQPHSGSTTGTATQAYWPNPTVPVETEAHQLKLSIWNSAHCWLWVKAQKALLLRHHVPACCHTSHRYIAPPGWLQ